MHPQRVNAWTCSLCGELWSSQAEAAHCCAATDQCLKCHRPSETEICRDCLDCIQTAEWSQAPKQAAPHDGRIWSDLLSDEFAVPTFLDEVCRHLTARERRGEDPVSIRAADLRGRDMADVARLLLCYVMEPANPRPFDLLEWLEDFHPRCSPRGSEKEISDVVNRFIARKAPWAWIPTAAAWSGRVGEPEFETGLAPDEWAEWFPYLPDCDLPDCAAPTTES